MFLASNFCSSQRGNCVSFTKLCSWIFRLRQSLQTLLKYLFDFFRRSFIRVSVSLNDKQKWLKDLLPVICKFRVPCKRYVYTLNCFVKQLVKHAIYLLETLFASSVWKVCLTYKINLLPTILYIFLVSQNVITWYSA